MKTLDLLKNAKWKAGGMISQEVRERGTRVGFKLIDIATGKEGWLAHIRQPAGPRISKYRVNLHDLNEVGVRAIENALEVADIIIIDEVGPMELFSDKFKDSVMKSIKSEKPLLGTIHWKARDPLIDFIKASKNVKIYEVTFRNREILPRLIFETLSKWHLEE
jgi:nucleoside-triphosphatase